MLHVNLKIFGIDSTDGTDKLIVRYRLSEHGKWKRNGFFVFPMPVSVQELFERAYIELKADVVYLQRSLLNNQELDDTYS